MNWLSENYKWLFDGVAGAAVIAVIGYVIHHFLGSQGRQQGAAALTAQGAKVTDSPVASGSGVITHTVNSPTFNLSLPAPTEATPAPQGGPMAAKKRMIEGTAEELEKNLMPRVEIAGIGDETNIEKVNE